jgi:hypothetical protein
VTDSQLLWNALPSAVAGHVVNAEPMHSTAARLRGRRAANVTGIPFPAFKPATKESNSPIERVVASASVDVG